MTDQAMLTEMARSLAIIERYWATHFRTGDEIDALTIHQARTILTDATLDPSTQPIKSVGFPTFSGRRSMGEIQEQHQRITVGGDCAPTDGPLPRLKPRV